VKHPFIANLLLGLPPKRAVAKEISHSKYFNKLSGALYFVGQSMYKRVYILKSGIVISDPCGLYPVLKFDDHTNK
jgi:hypothetical protein